MTAASLNTFGNFKTDFERDLAVKEAETKLRRLKQMFLWGEATLDDLKQAKAELLAAS